MKIGTIELENNLILAPMAGVTSLPFRLLCKKYGCSLVTCEMASINAIVRKNNLAMKKATVCTEEKPVAVQLFGQKPELFIEAAKQVEGDIIDINFGCPNLRVMRQGAGSALMKRPQKIFEIVSAAVKAINRPVTAKIRSGLDHRHINAVELAKLIEKAGAAAITVHGRNIAQKYSGKADWEIIKAVKDAVGIPVIANGDIKDEISAEKCLKETGADALMIGRAAMGEPYIFRRIMYYLKTGKMLPRQTLAQKIDDFFEYINLAKNYNCLNYPEVKTHAMWFTKSLEGNNKIRNRLSICNDTEKIIQVMNEWKKEKNF